MSLISATIPNFVNGISQQPFTLRLSSQGELQENGLSTVSAGLRKRPPTEHLAQISTTPLANAFVHMIDRDGSERYQVIVTNGDLKVYDLAGIPQVVNFTDKAYLNTALSADVSFAITTVADYSFVVNKSKRVAALTTLSPARPSEALVSVKAGYYGKTYSIVINGAPAASYTVPNGSTTADAPMVAADYIATQLAASLVSAAPFNAAPWTVTRYGSVLHLRNTGADFSISCEDGFGNTAMVAIKGKLQKFSDLPANPRVDSFMVQITGDQASAFDNYWVAFDAGGNNNTTGVWKETLAPGISVGLDPTTMPHQLVREANGTFTFRPAVWTNRAVGDIKSNPDPSFVGGTINDVFFFQNRLGLLSDENYIQSETGKYFNCYRTTVTTLLDSDPVDVNAATNKVAVLNHAISFNKTLLLFSNQQQFVVESDQLMTPKRVPIKPTTDFAVNGMAKPVAAGRNVYFSQDKGNWSSVREYFADMNNLTNDASDITSHVPKYIPSGVVKIAAGAGEDVLAILSGSDRTRLFIYKYYFSGNDKLQSSWSLFNFAAGGTILGCDFIRSVLYLVVSRADGVYFEKMDFAAGAAVVGEPYPVHLDRKVKVPTSAMTFDGVFTQINTASLGYTPTGTGYMAVAHGGGPIKAGQLLPVVFDGALVKIMGDLTASPLSFGQRYTWRYTLSPLTLKFPSTGGSTQSDTAGRTQVRTIGFNHADTGYYKVLVTPQARQTYTYVFGGKILGAASARIGVSALATGRFVVPVMSRNTTVSIVVESDMPNPVALLSADWEAMYAKRSMPMRGSA